jgi:trk system potassium uptake protein TrkA
MARNAASREFAVVGAGRMGSSLARRLEELGHAVLVIDTDRARIQEIAAEVTNAVVLDATNPEALEAVDIRSFGTVVVAIADNFEAAVLVVATLKDLEIPIVWAQARTSLHQEILQRVGANRVVRPLEESGRRVADELDNPWLEDRLSLAGGLELVKVAVPDRLVGRAVSEVPGGASVFLVVRREKVLFGTLVPNTFEAGDELVVLADERQLAMLSGTE